MRHADEKKGMRHADEKTRRHADVKKRPRGKTVTSSPNTCISGRNLIKRS
jgi:hypothetical protein